MRVGERISTKDNDFDSEIAITRRHFENTIPDYRRLHLAENRGDILMQNTTWIWAGGFFKTPPEGKTKRVFVFRRTVWSNA